MEVVIVCELLEDGGECCVIREALCSIGRCALCVVLLPLAAAAAAVAAAVDRLLPFAAADAVLYGSMCWLLRVCVFLVLAIVHANFCQANFRLLRRLSPLSRRTIALCQPANSHRRLLG